MPARRWRQVPPRYWVHPELVVEVEHLEWTEDEVLRHPVLKAVLPDRKPSDVGGR